MLDRRTTLVRRNAAAPDDDAVVVPASRPAGSARRQSPVLEVLWNRRWVVLGAVFLALAGAVVYLVKSTPVYGSASTIYIEQNLPNLLTDGAGGRANAAGYLFTQCELIRSTAILADAAGRPEAAQVEGLRVSDNPVGYLKSVVGTDVSRQGDIISVSAESTRPADAALVVNAVVDAYIEHHNRQHRSTAAEVWKVLKKEKDAYAKDLADLSGAMLKFKRENGTLSFESDKGNIVTQRLEELSNAVTKAQLELLDAQVGLDSAEVLAKTPDRFKEFVVAQRDRELGGGGGVGLDARRNELQQLERLAERLRRQYGENYPQLTTVRGQVEDLRAELGEAAAASAGGTGPAEQKADQKFVDTWLAVMRETRARAKRREAALTAKLGEQQAAAMDLNGKAAEYAQMEGASRRSEKMLDALDARMKEVGVTGNADAAALNSVTVLEVAKPNPLPVRPVRGKTLGLAVVIGLMAGLGAALALDWMDHRIRSADEVGDILGVNVLGVIPHIPGKLSASQRGQEIHLRPRSDVAEAYRTIRTAIYFGAPEVNSKTILVTSPSPGDGKSTMASNLALAIAQAGRRVLLVDADCRKPVQHRIFRVEQAIGLSSVLAGEATADQAVQPGVVGGLDLLPCGPLPPNPAELLNSPAFVALLAELSQRYDQVVVDSPPVVPVTDARVLAAACDVTVLVVRAEKSTRRTSEHARDALTGVGANLLGAVVNDIPRRGGGAYGYGYGQYYAYGYGPKGDSAGGPSAAPAAGAQRNGTARPGGNGTKALSA